jgi:hypothetical protein
MKIKKEMEVMREKIEEVEVDPYLKEVYIINLDHNLKALITKKRKKKLKMKKLI